MIGYNIQEHTVRTCTSKVTFAQDYITVSNSCMLGFLYSYSNVRSIHSYNLLLEYRVLIIYS
jgi:hypothetical protein